MNQKEGEETKKKADNMHLQSLTYFGYLASVETPPKSLLASHMSVGAQTLAD